MKYIYNIYSSGITMYSSGITMHPSSIPEGPQLQINIEQTKLQHRMYNMDRNIYN